MGRRVCNKSLIKYLFGGSKGSLWDGDPSRWWVSSRTPVLFLSSTSSCPAQFLFQEMLHKYLLNELIGFDRITMPSQPLGWVLESEIYCLSTGTFLGWGIWNKRSALLCQLDHLELLFSPLPHTCFEIYFCSSVILAWEVERHSWH